MKQWVIRFNAKKKLFLGVLLLSMATVSLLPISAWAKSQVLSAVMCPKEKKTATYKFDTQTDSAQVDWGTANGTDGNPLVTGRFRLETGKLIMTAGQNDGKTPLTTTVKITITYTQLPAGISRSKSGGIGKTTRSETTIVNVTVKPQSQCIPPSKNAAKDRAAIPGIPKREKEEDSQGWSPGYYQKIDVCEGGQELVGNPNSDGMARFVEERIKARDGVLRISDPPKPEIAKLEWFSYQTSKIPSLLVHGLREGITPAGLTSTAGKVFSFNIHVRPCTGPGKEGPKNLISQGSVTKAPLGRVALPLPNEVTFVPKPVVRSESYPTLGLNTAVVELPEGSVLVHCPGDARPGDKISCSIQTDGSDLTSYGVQMESVATFVDDDVIETEVSPNALGLPIQILDEQNGLVAEVSLPLETVTTFEDDDEDSSISQNAKGLVFPNALMVGGPILLGGDFNASPQEIFVTVGGAKAPMLARSPRSLIVVNPATAVGEQQEIHVVVSGVGWKASIENTIGDTAVAAFMDTVQSTVKNGQKHMVAQEGGGMVNLNVPPLDKLDEVAEQKLAEDMRDFLIDARNRRLIRSIHAPMDYQTLKRLFIEMRVNPAEQRRLLLGFDKKHKNTASATATSEKPAKKSVGPLTPEEAKKEVNKLDLTPQAKRKLGEYILPDTGKKAQAQYPQQEQEQEQASASPSPELRGLGGNTGDASNVPQVMTTPDPIGGIKADYRYNPASSAIRKTPSDRTEEVGATKESTGKVGASVPSGGVQLPGNSWMIPEFAEQIKRQQAELQEVMNAPKTSVNLPPVLSTPIPKGPETLQGQPNTAVKSKIGEAGKVNMSNTEFKDKDSGNPPPPSREQIRGASETSVEAVGGVESTPATPVSTSEGLAHSGRQQTALAENPVQNMIQEMCNATVNAYRQNLRFMVDEGWKPPKPPSKGTWIAKLQYDLVKGGGVSNVRVVQPSGYRPIDQSAIQRVYQLKDQFRPIPQCYPGETLDIDHTFKVIYR